MVGSALGDMVQSFRRTGSLRYSFRRRPAPADAVCAGKDRRALLISDTAGSVGQFASIGCRHIWSTFTHPLFVAGCSFRGNFVNIFVIVGYDPPPPHSTDVLLLPHLIL